MRFLTEGAPSLLERVLGARFEELAPEVQALHRSSGMLKGEVTVRCAAPLRLLGFPAPCEGAPLQFHVQEEEGVVFWTRWINGKELRSELWADGARVVERMGAVTMTSEPVIEGGALRLEPRAVRLFDLPLPRAFWPRVKTREWGENGRYCFAVEVRAPFGGGVLMAYEGWLSPAG